MNDKIYYGNFLGCFNVCDSTCTQYDSNCLEDVKKFIANEMNLCEEMGYFEKDMHFCIYQKIGDSI